MQAVRDVYETGRVSAVLALVARVERPEVVGYLLGRSHLLGADENDILVHLASPDSAYRLLARSYAGGKVQEGGWEWAEDVVRQRTSSWTADQGADFLLGLPASPRAWDWAETMGEDTDRAYWTLRGPYGLAEPDSYPRAAAKFAQYDLAITAACLLGAYISRTETTIDPQLVAHVLDTASQQSWEGVEWTMFVSAVTLLLDVLETAETIDDARLARLEWAYLPLFQDGRRAARVLQRALAQEPAFLVEVLTWVYKADGEEDRHLSDREVALAHGGYSLLESWRHVPGHQKDGTIDAATLKKWVEQVRVLSAERHRQTMGDYHIGRILRYTPERADGAWPDRAARDIIEDAASDDLDAGLRTEVINSRGTTSRGLTDGGAQEWALVERYSGYATSVADGWPRTAALLRCLADRYAQLARREDADAERRQDRW